MIGKMDKEAFYSGSEKGKIKHWVCAKEKHQNSWEHYHVALIKGDSSKTLKNREKTHMIE